MRVLITQKHYPPPPPQHTHTHTASMVQCLVLVMRQLPKPVVKFFDLELLLPTRYKLRMSHSHKRLKMAEDGDCLLVFTTTSSSHEWNIDSLSSWLEAWSVLAVHMASNAPQCAVSLAQHQPIIVQAAAKHWLAAVLEYDIRVRQAVSRLQMSLDTLDAALNTECSMGQALPACSRCFQFPFSWL